MFMFLVTFVASSFAMLSLASPVGRQTAVCPWNGVPNASNFVLLAVSRVDTSIRKPLALVLNGLPGSSTAWLGSAESTDPIVASKFVLSDGGITAYAADGSLVGVSNPVASENGWLSFLLPDKGVTISPAEVYCELFNTSPYGVEFPNTLAVNGGDSDHFSLCKSSTSDEFVVIYNAVEASSGDAGFEWTTCTAVDIPVLPK
ncbi:hypothetical protein B0F90DRAFT_1696130 [Multifurca ochricompacta]|uniref:Uncharacterized protein n=1 Tax=Multifurca ochricompacta TaxID=376703 RepID=A0AAD4M9U7_9AGAM|nr:hypothetical protein B0F90DRAFT_1696130 [Multifurca ochricompacta]